MNADLDTRNTGTLLRSDRLVRLALLCAAIAPFIASLGFGFVMDDTTAIRSNPDLAGWDALYMVWTHPYGGEGSPFFGLYRPLTMAVFAFVWNLGGHWPLWLHVLAVLLHAIATLLVHRMLVQIGGRVPALAGALWFAVHPVHVEAVANIANSSEVLVAIWTCLLALHLARAGHDTAGIGWTGAIGAGVLYLLAFLSKESGAVAAPLALLWVWIRGVPLRRFARVVPVFAVAAVLVLAARAAVLGGIVGGDDIGTPGLAELSHLQRVGAMLSLGPRIAELLLWPATINPHYGPSSFPTPVGLWAGATLVVALVLLGVGAWRARRGDRRWLGAMAWVAIAFLPASNLLVATGQILAERTLYVASIAIAMLVCVTIDAIPAAARDARTRRNLARVVAAGVTALTLVAAVRTRRFVEVWRDHRSLFAQIVAADSANYRGFWLSGLEARNSGSIPDALTLLGKAHAMYPSDRGLRIDYSETLLHAGRPTQAAEIAAGLLSSPKHRTRPYVVALYLEAVEQAFGADSVTAAATTLMRTAPSPTAALFLGRAYESRGMTDSAAAVYRRGLAMAPGDSALGLRLRVLGATR